MSGVKARKDCPAELGRLCSIPKATCAKARVKCHQLGKPIRDSGPRAFAGCCHVGTPWLAHAQSRTPRRKAGVQHRAAPSVNSVGTVSRSYQFWNWGDPPKPKFLGSSQGPTMQAGLSQDGSKPAELTLPHIPHVLRSLSIQGLDLYSQILCTNNSFKKLSFPPVLKGLEG